jgi:hypothetical protein
LTIFNVGKIESRNNCFDFALDNNFTPIIKKGKNFDLNKTGKTTLLLIRGETNMSKTATLIDNVYVAVNLQLMLAPKCHN